MSQKNKIILYSFINKHLQNIHLDDWSKKNIFLSDCSFFN